jgi:hypothetical protein
MPSPPVIVGVKQVFSPPLVEDVASQHGNCRLYPRPEGGMTFACLGSEFQTATVGWHGGLFEGERDVTDDHPVLRRIMEENAYGLMLDSYQPWSSDGRLLLLSNWNSHVYFYNVHAKASRRLDIPPTGVVALGSADIPRYFVGDAQSRHLLDLEGRAELLRLPCSGVGYFRWMSVSPFLLAIGRHAETRLSTLWIIDGETGHVAGSHTLDPLRLNSKTYQLGDVGQMQITQDLETGIIYLKPLHPGAQAWALEMGE